MQQPDPKATTEPTPFERFERLARKVVNTPKSVVDRDKEERRSRRSIAPKKRR